MTTFVNWIKPFSEDPNGFFYGHLDECSLYSCEHSLLQKDRDLVFQHFSLPISRQKSDPCCHFQALRNEWVNETKYFSSAEQKFLHPAYQKIIGMGRKAIPFIINDLLDEPQHWFWALKSITGEDPVPPASRGRIKEMIQHWLQWYIENYFE